MNSSLKSIFLASLLALVLLAPASLQAQEDQEVTESIKNRLQETISSIDESEVSPLLRGFVGEVKDIVKDVIVIQDKTGKKSIVIGDDSSITRSPGSATIKLESVRIGDSILAIGKPLDNELELSALKVIVSENSFSPPEKLTSLGKVTDIGRYSFMIATPTDTVEVFFTAKTVYKSPDSTIELEDIKVGDEVIFTAGRDKDGDWSATVIMQTRDSSL